MKAKAKVFFQVLAGLAMGAAVSVWLVYSSVPIFWEHEDPQQHDVYSLTWRSALMFFLIVAATQGFSFLMFRWRRKPRVGRAKWYSRRHGTGT